MIRELDSDSVNFAYDCRRCRDLTTAQTRMVP